MTKVNRLPLVLFFHAGMNPTDEDREKVAGIGARVGFRNAHQVSDVAFSPLEECDAVAGAVPARYAKTYPNVDGVIAEGRLLRMSDYDRKHGPVTHVDNEAARAAKPPSMGQDRLTANGAPRPVGAITALDGGFVAPTPGNPDNLQAFGSERAENGTEGSNTEAQVSRTNPQGLPDVGVALPRTGTADTGAAGPVVAEGGGQDGFRAPTPADTEGDDAEGSTGSRKRRGGSTGSTGSTGATGDSGSNS